MPETGSAFSATSPPVRYTRFTVRTDEFDYWLPRAQIAQRPLPRRDASRLLLLERSTGATTDFRFAQLPDLLRGDELLVFNNARVIPARLFGKRAGVHSQSPSRATAKEHLSGIVEVAGELEAEILSRGDLGLRTMQFSSRDENLAEKHMERLGHVPLPPYIEREDENSDRERYQTVFAKKAGAIAAPTAGLHFSQEMMARLREKGIELCELTLDVGLGTFQPIHSETLEQHVMHAEQYEISEETAGSIMAARAAKRAILPGYKFLAVDALLTNFHLPRSTLLALVCSFAGREQVLAAYRHAIDAEYRFYSYGDCMLIR